MNINPSWLRTMANKEGNCILSVGGLVSDIAGQVRESVASAYRETQEESKRLDAADEERVRRWNG